MTGEGNCDKCNKCNIAKYASWLFAYLSDVLDKVPPTSASDGVLLDTFCEVVTSSMSLHSNKYTARVLCATVRLAMYHSSVFRRQVTAFAPVFAYRTLTDNILGTLSMVSRVATEAPGDGLLAGARCGEAFLQIVYTSLGRIVTNNLMMDMQVYCGATNRTMMEFGKALEAVAKNVVAPMDLPSMCVYRSQDTIEFGYDENDRLCGEVTHASYDADNYKFILRHLAVDGPRGNITVADKS